MYQLMRNQTKMGQDFKFEGHGDKFSLFQICRKIGNCSLFESILVGFAEDGLHIGRILQQRSSNIQMTYPIGVNGQVQIFL